MSHLKLIRKAQAETVRDINKLKAELKVARSHGLRHTECLLVQTITRLDEQFDRLEKAAA